MAKKAMRKQHNDKIRKENIENITLDIEFLLTFLITAFLTGSEPTAAPEYNLICAIRLQEDKNNVEVK